MDTIEFKPTKTLLVFWILGVIVACLPIGGMATGAVAEMDIAVQKAFLYGYFIPLVLMTLYAILFFHTIRYEMTDRYITASSGVLWKKRRSIPLSKITNIDVRQGPFERIFGYGKIWIFTPSTGSALPEEKLLGIVKPHEMKQAIIDRTEAAKQPLAMPSNGSALESPKDVVLLLTDIRDSLHRMEASLTKE